MVCKQPSRLYSLFLKERWLWCQIKRIQHKTYENLETPKISIDTSQEVGEYGKYQLSEFYLHKHIVSHHFKWIPIKR